MKKIYFFIVSILLFQNIAKAQIVSIPDANFKARLIQLGVDQGNGTANSQPDGEIQVSEAQAVIGLDLEGANIANLMGIEAFINLVSLNCINNSIISLGTLPTALQQLYCYNNLLTGSLNFNGYTNLTVINCGDNFLSGISVQGCNNLVQLACGNNQIETLDISNLPNLTQLWCDRNQITWFDSTNSSQLISLVWNNNPFSTITMANGFAGDTIILNDFTDTLQSVNISGCTNIFQFHCNDMDYNGTLSSLNVLGCSNLQYLTCIGNNLTSLITSQLTSLTYFDCSKNRISTLDLSTNTALVQVICPENLLTSINLTYLENLQYLLCEKNQFTTLDIPNSPLLRRLHCDDNLLTSINLASYNNLEALYCSGNLFTTLNVCDYQNLSSFVIYNNPNLRTVFMNNGYNWEPNINFHCYNMPDLIYLGITPSSVTATENYFSTQGITATVDTSCQYLSVESSNAPKFKLFPNPASSILFIDIPENNTIDAVTVSDTSGKKVLEQTGDKKEINIEKLTGGMYIIQLTSGDKIYTEKFIKL